MKTIQKFLLVLFIYTISNLVAVAQNGGIVTLNGKLKGFNNQVVVEDMSEFQYLLPPTAERMVIPDSLGNFSIKFKLNAANYFRLGRNALYLTPGDHMELFIDYGDPQKATFKGVGADANNYLKKAPFPKGGSYIEAGTNVKNTPEETIAAVETLATARTAELALLVKVTPEFRRLETARIKADLINSFMNGQFYSTYKLKLKDEEEKQFITQYQKAISPKVKAYSKDFTDASLLKIVVYRDIANELIKEGSKEEDIQVIKDFYAVSKLVKEMQKVSDKQLFAPFAKQLTELKTISYQTAASKMLKNLMAFGKGDMAVDFTVVNTKGQKINLSSLKGKVIYVDLWATWCGPCMQEMPSFEKLKMQYKDNSNVVFVSLSIDDNEGLWKADVAQRKADGYQWLINRAKLQAYNIVGIPRSLLIDKDFKIANMAAPMPSEAAVVKAIDLLLK